MWCKDAWRHMPPLPDWSSCAGSLLFCFEPHNLMAELGKKRNWNVPASTCHSIAYNWIGHYWLHVLQNNWGCLSQSQDFVLRLHCSSTFSEQISPRCFSFSQSHLRPEMLRKANSPISMGKSLAIDTIVWSSCTPLTKHSIEEMFYCFLCGLRTGTPKTRLSKTSPT